MNFELINCFAVAALLAAFLVAFLLKNCGKKPRSGCCSTKEHPLASGHSSPFTNPRSYCPCQLVEPCNKNCPCGSSVMSGGCWRCVPRCEDKSAQRKHAQLLAAWIDAGYHSMKHKKEKED